MNPAENTSTVNQSPARTEPPVSPEPPLDLTQALWQLRMLCCGLGLGLLVVSLTFNAFVWKQDRNIAAETNARIEQTTLIEKQSAQIQDNQQRLRPVAEELARYSIGNPELVDIFKRAGLNISAAPTSNPAPSSAATP